MRLNLVAITGHRLRDRRRGIVSRDLGEPLRVGAGGLLPLRDVGEHHPGAGHVGQRGACLVECLFGDVEAADRLGVGVTGAAVPPPRAIGAVPATQT